MNLPPVVSATEWQAARDALLAKEKEATRARDALAAERRRLPRVRIDKDYTFDGPDGKAGLVDLFEGRRQLLLYHFIFGPNHDAGCDGCSLFVYQDGESFGLSVFLHDGDDVFRSYFTTHRGVEALGSVWTFLDLTPLGRQEQWEDSPAGYPQTKPYEWWRRHDEYEDAEPA